MTATTTTTTTKPAEIRYLGPYSFRGQYRCQMVNGQRRSWLTPEATPERAERVAQQLLAELTARQPMTVGQALDSYAEYMTAKGNKPLSVTTTLYRLQRFFAENALAVNLLTQRRCAGYYQTIASKQRPDTHRNTLSEARTFCRWLVKQHLLRTNPIDSIEPMGSRNKGKPQLHSDEAKRWLGEAEKLAQQGEAGAVAAMMTLLMGLRCSEVIERTMRDLDDGGRVVCVPVGKTPASRRRVEVPAMLQPYLQELKRDKLPMALLFGHHYRDWPRRWVKKICRLARVPVVCAHGMRGLFATLGVENSPTPHIVAAALGHESAAITMSNYAAPGSAQRATQRRALSVLLNRGD